MDHLCYFCVVLLCFHARLFVDAFWSPDEKGLISWLSFVMYLFLIFALFLTVNVYASNVTAKFQNVHLLPLLGRC